MSLDEHPIEPHKGNGARSLRSIPDEALQAIVEAIQGLDFGSIEITVHDGRISQIERREKFRFKS
jgi:hypothetical protein